MWFFALLSLALAIVAVIRLNTASAQLRDVSRKTGSVAEQLRNEQLKIERELQALRERLGGE